MLAVACNESEKSVAPVVQEATGENVNNGEGESPESKPIFREEEPEGGWENGIPPTLAAAANKHWRMSKKRPTGIMYVEMKFFTDYLLMRTIPGNPFDSIPFTLSGDTINPMRANAETGEYEPTNDFFLIERVWGDDLNIMSYSRDNLEKATSLELKRMVNK